MHCCRPTGARIFYGKLKKKCFFSQFLRKEYEIERNKPKKKVLVHY